MNQLKSSVGALQRLLSAGQQLEAELTVECRTDESLKSKVAELSKMLGGMSDFIKEATMTLAEHRGRTKCDGKLAEYAAELVQLASAADAHIGGFKESQKRFSALLA